MVVRGQRNSSAALSGLGTNCTAGWVRLGTGVENLTFTGIRSSECPFPKPLAVPTTLTPNTFKNFQRRYPVLVLMGVCFKYFCGCSLYSCRDTEVSVMFKYRVILSVLDPRKCEYLKDYSLDFEHAHMTTYLASWKAC